MLHTLLLFGSGSAAAATYRVDASGGATFTTIGDAVAIAEDGDTIQVLAGTYTESLNLEDRQLQLIGADSSTTILDATGYSSALQIVGGEAEISGFTIRNLEGSGIVSHGSELEISSVQFEDLGIEGSQGAAVYILGGIARIEDSTFTGGTARYGGAIYMASQADVVIESSTFSNNKASYGGAVYLYRADVLTITDTVFETNQASIEGGSLYINHNTYAASLTDVEILDSHSDGNGGAIAMYYGDGLWLTDLSVTDSSADDGYGGALFSYDAEILLSEVEIQGNSASSGGGIFLDWSTLEATEFTLTENSASSSGAGMYARYSPSILLNQSRIAENVATTDGGGIYAYYLYGTVELQDVEFEGNHALYGSAGGLMLYSDSTLVGSNVNFLDNTAYYHGAGLYQYYASLLELEDCSFIENENTYYHGGAIFHYYPYGTLSLTRCELTNNLAGSYGYGGAIYGYYNSSVFIQDSTLEGNWAAYSGGAVYHDYYGSLQITDSVLENNSTEYSGGAGVWTRFASEVEIDSTDFSRHQAPLDGGALHIREASGSVQIRDSNFSENEVDSSGFGGALFLYGLTDVRLSRNQFLSNFGGYGGAVYAQEVRPGKDQTHTWENNRLQDNMSGSGGAACLLGTTGTRLQNNSLVGNQSATDGGALCLYDVDLVLVNNIFAYTSGSATIALYDTESVETLSFSFNDFYENSGGDASLKLSAEQITSEDGNLFQDPTFATFTHDGDPTTDSLVLARSSPLIDAGDPELTDPDGSRSDVGMYGGPDAPTEDEDQDGYDATVDCDDTNSDIHPDAEEIWYDGINSDCTEGSDYDADGDGEDALEWGGIDCDDSDPSIIDCESEDTGADLTDTADPEEVDTGVEEGEQWIGGDLVGSHCSCSNGAPQSRAWLAGLLIMLVSWRRGPHASCDRISLSRVRDPSQRKHS